MDPADTSLGKSNVFVDPKDVSSLKAVCVSMSKRRRTTNNSAVSLSHLFRTAVPELSKGDEELQSSPHVYDTGHEAAAPFTEEIELTDQETYLFDGGQDSSYLLQKLHDQGLESFTYQNETKVQNLVALCLEDALRSQGHICRMFSGQFLVGSTSNGFSSLPCRAQLEAAEDFRPRSRIQQPSARKGVALLQG